MAYPTPPLDPSRTTLLVIDVQNDFCSPRGVMAQKKGADVAPLQEAIVQMNKLIHTARRAGSHVVYFRVEHAPEFMYPNKRTARVTGDKAWLVAEGDWGAELSETLEPPRPGERVLTKFNYDCFYSTPLDLLLRATSTSWVVVAGVLTNVCVDTTARSAYMRGYHVIVPSDATASYDVELHRASLKTLGKYFGRVVETDHLIQEWHRAAVSAV